MSRSYYSASVEDFLADDEMAILGCMTARHQHVLEEQQRNAWLEQIRILKESDLGAVRHIAFEYSVPRMGKRIDCLLFLNRVILAIEFKVGERQFPAHAIRQIYDYALDLKNFHGGSQNVAIVPVLLCTHASTCSIQFQWATDLLAEPICINQVRINDILNRDWSLITSAEIRPQDWIDSVYKPTPTIIEAAQALYERHEVKEILRSDAGAVNLSQTADAIMEIISHSKENLQKSICFVTGVPGAGKTLAGLNIANRLQDAASEEHAVFLSGNGPLVKVLREALVRNSMKRSREQGKRLRKSDIEPRVKAFIQNVHHFRDDAIANKSAPHERIVVFDEAQRAWNVEQTSAFMKKKRGLNSFGKSEPEFLIGVMDRHTDWSVIVCLVGEGQEINTGEAGIVEWFESLKRSFPAWNVYVSDLNSIDASNLITQHASANNVAECPKLHLGVSIRSFRSELVSSFIKELIEGREQNCKTVLADVKGKFPIRLTRDLEMAKTWLKEMARGSERTGALASSEGIRLRAHGVHVKAKLDPTQWFLNDFDDVRTSNFLESVATEFDVQGLELDWTCICWDADFRMTSAGWGYFNFRGTKWQRINKIENQNYLKNAYRVLLTRARQGMVIWIPEGDPEDITRKPEFYDRTYAFFRDIGIAEL